MLVLHTARLQIFKVESSRHGSATISFSPGRIVPLRSGGDNRTTLPFFTLLIPGNLFITPFYWVIPNSGRQSSSSRIVEDVPSSRSCVICV